MNTIIIKTQAELDKLPNSFKEYTSIQISSSERIYVSVIRGNSNVEAWENSNVEARGNSNVEAWENSGVHLYSSKNTNLHNYSVCWEIQSSKATKKSKTATIIKPKLSKGLKGWLDANAIEKKPSIILYKKVSKDFKTQEGTLNETVWTISKTLTHSNWTPKKEECGEGKYHACSRAYFCDEFRNESGDIYIAVKVSLKDVYSWPNPSYPHKIAFRKGKVMYQCTKLGTKT